MRTPEQSCGNCAWFIDHRMPDDKPGEVNGYCSNLAHAEYSEEHGGHWTCDAHWCDGWVAGSSIPSETDKE